MTALVLTGHGSVLLISVYQTAPRAAGMFVINVSVRSGPGDKEVFTKFTGSWLLPAGRVAAYVVALGESRHRKGLMAPHHKPSSIVLDQRPPILVTFAFSVHRQ